MLHESMVFSWRDEHVLVAPPRCGLVAVPDFIRQINTWCCQGTSATLVVDLSGVREWDMSVFRPLVWARRRCVAAGGDLAVVLPTCQVFSDPEVALLAQVFPAAHGQSTGATEPVADERSRLSA